MCAEGYTSDTFPLLLFLDAKFVNSFQQNTQYFNTHCGISSFLNNILTIDHRRYSVNDVP